MGGTPLINPKIFPGQKSDPLDKNEIHVIQSPMETANQFVSTSIAPVEFSTDMLRDLHLSADPEAVAAQYGLVYEHIKDLPHFKKRMEQVQNALMVDGSFAPIIAGAGLHTAVEKLAKRVQDDRIPTGDLVKAIEVFKKVKDGSATEGGPNKGSGVSLIINIPAIGTTGPRTVEIVAEPSKELQAYNTIEAEALEVESGSYTESDTEDEPKEVTSAPDFTIGLP